MTKQTQSIFLSNFVNVFEFLIKENLIVFKPENNDLDFYENLLEKYLVECEQKMKEFDPNIIINALIKHAAELKPQN
jgi:hypothetical protein